MARVPLVTQSALPEEYQYCLTRPISILRALGNSPGALKVHHEYAEWIRWHSKFDPRLRQLAIIYVALLLRNDYEYSHHVKLGFQFGVTEEDISALDSFHDDGDGTHFRADEVVALEFVREFVNHHQINDDAWRSVVGVYGNELATELTAIVGFYCYVSLVIDVLKIPVEEEYAQYVRDW